MAKDAPSLVQPKVKPTKEAKERKIKTAPVISNDDKAQSDESLVREAEGFSEPVAEIKKEVLTEEVHEEPVEQEVEEQPVDRMAELKRKIAMSRAAKVNDTPAEEPKEEVKAEVKEEVKSEPQPTVEKSKADLVREKLAFLKARKG